MSKHPDTLPNLQHHKEMSEDQQKLSNDVYWAIRHYVSRLMIHGVAKSARINEDTINSIADGVVEEVDGSGIYIKQVNEIESDDG